MKFHFMTHDKWANVLFLHWRVPPTLESLLSQQTTPFQLDRTDGSAWVGLILLTEFNVGPSHQLLLRGTRTCVTHHGVNIRTYVRAKSDSTTSEYEDNRGIYFSSLECDARFTSFGANLFGMPYKVASIQRIFQLDEDFDDKEKERDGLMKQNLMSSREVDEVMCSNDNINQHAKTQSLKSVRSKRPRPSLCNLLLSFLGYDEAEMHSTRLVFEDGDGLSSQSSNSLFTVECQWERHQKEPIADMAHWFVERYHVYTRKYGTNWRGTVEHEPWPVECALLHKLEISNVDAYEPAAMRPLVRYMANTEPESVLFSAGVGPVDFQMLKPTR